MKAEGGLRTKSVFKAGSEEKPLVSIITVVYNGEQYIEHTIQSILKQTYSNIEYIIVDGGSTDNTLAILKRYEDKIDYWLSEPDKGISDAFNKGISHASGEIIGIINADDWYQPDAIKLIVKNFGQNDVLYGNIVYWRNDKIDKVSLADHNLLPREMSLNHMAVFIRKEAYNKWGLFDISRKYAMDYDLLLRFYLKGARYKYVNEIIANMRWGGLSDNKWLAAVKEVHQIKIKNKLPGLSAMLYTVKIFFFITGSKILYKMGVRSFYLKVKKALQIKQATKIYEEN